MSRESKKIKTCDKLCPEQDEGRRKTNEGNTISSLWSAKSSPSFPNKSFRDQHCHVEDPIEKD